MKEASNSYYNRYHTGDATYQASLGVLHQRMKIFNRFIKINSKVLDFGCGHGLLLNEAGRNKTLHDESFGYDISEVVIKKAKERYPHLRFGIIPNSGRLPFEDGKFDVIITSEVIEHVIDTELVFREFNRLLKKGGLLLISTNCYSWFKDLVLVLTFRHKMHFHNVFWHHIRFYTRNSIMRVLRKFGFSKEYYKEIGKLPLLRQRMMVVGKKLHDLS